jgi:uncharacterized protein YmfQ (DUF2313 family)
MAALKDYLDEMARIKQELQRMENDDSVTEDNEGDLRDTLLARWEELDGLTKPIIERMEKIRSITRTAAADEGNLERPYGVSRAGNGGRGPDLAVRNHRDPFGEMDRAREGMMPSGELRERALDAIELVAKRGMAVHDFAEEATRKVQDGGYFSKNNIARHILETGSPEYYDAFAKYIANPDDMAARAALNLGVASGGYLLPFVLDCQVA